MNSKPQTTSESEPIEPGRNRRKLIMTLSLVAAALIAMVLIYIAVSDDADNNVGELFTVKKEPLIITISESGTIKPINQIVLTNELEGMTRILYLIPESTQVKKGDLLVELETSELETQKINQEIQVKNADAALVQAEANLSITTNQADSDVAQAELNKEFAEMDLEKYMKGEYPQELEQTKANITIAEEELKRAKDRLEGSKKLAEKKFISQTDLEADELAAKQKEINLKLAEGKLKLLEEYTHPRRVKELKSNIEQTTKALERTEQKADADKNQARVQRDAKKAELDRQQTTLDRVCKQIEKAKIYAPQDGMVVYATTANRRWWSNEDPLAEGQQVRERQELIHLPTSAGMKAEIKINESALGKVKIGLPVTVQVDALDREKTFAAKVTKISPMPDSQSRFMNPDLSVYAAEVQLEGDVTGLKTGMSCQVEILVAEYESVIPVPVQCVMQVDGKPTVYVHDGDKTTARTVKTGLDNNRMVAVLSGLKEGEKILLNPPLSKAAVSANKNHEAFSKAKEVTEAGTATDKAGGDPGNSANAEAKTDNEEAKKPDKATMEETRKKFESMTPEERKTMRNRHPGRSDGNSSPAPSPPPPR